MRRLRNKTEYKRWLAVSVAIVFVMLPSLSMGEIQAAGDSAKIALSKNSITIKQGITYKMNIRNKPDGAKTVWSSKNKKIAKVKRGVITARKQGKTEIICKIVYKQGGRKQTEIRKAVVTVKKISRFTQSISPTERESAQSPEGLSGATIRNLLAGTGKDTGGKRSILMKK